MPQRPLVVILVRLLNFVLAELDGKVIDGDWVDIDSTPHSVFLDVICPSEDAYGWICGASIINQHFVLTAAHCLAPCTKNGHIAVAVGHEHNERGVVSSADKFKVHELFDKETMVADIGLVMLVTPFEFGRQIKRAVIKRNFPKIRVAYISGWGLIDERQQITIPWLKRAKQTIFDRDQCLEILDSMPEGDFCAGSIKGYPALGDSGSALVIKGYIQVGVVSYKQPYVNTTVIGYVNVSRYYNWINQSTSGVFCG